MSDDMNDLREFREFEDGVRRGLAAKADAIMRKRSCSAGSFAIFTPRSASAFASAGNPRFAASSVACMSNAVSRGKSFTPSTTTAKCSACGGAAESDHVSAIRA